MRLRNDKLRFRGFYARSELLALEAQSADCRFIRKLRRWRLRRIPLQQLHWACAEHDQLETGPPLRLHRERVLLQGYFLRVSLFDRRLSSRSIDQWDPSGPRSQS